MKTIELRPWLCCGLAVLALGRAAAEENAVVKQNHVNVRGQPSLAGEVITQLQKGEKVVVLEEVVGAKKTNEPPKWARIQMPANTPVWVFAGFIDSNKTVRVPRLNLRAGPGENYSVVGRLERGTPVKEIRRADRWIEIETPLGAYGYVAANLLAKGEAGAAIATQPAAQPSTVTAPPPAVTTPTPTTPAPEPAPAPTTNPAPREVTPPAPIEKPAESTTTAPPATVTTPPPPPVVPEPVVTPATRPETATPPPPTPEPSTPATTAKAKAQEPVIHRVVRREGIVRSTVSIQAPTYYELLSPQNHKTINYLHVDKLGLDLNDYRGRRVIVTGEEAIDPRWKNTPVIEVDHLELIP